MVNINIDYKGHTYRGPFSGSGDEVLTESLPQRVDFHMLRLLCKGKDTKAFVKLLDLLVKCERRRRNLTMTSWAPLT